MISLISEKVRGEMIITTFLFGILIGSCAGQCNPSELVKCAEPLAHLKDASFTTSFETVSDLFKECKIQLEAVSCVKSVVSICLPEEQQEVFQVIMAGKQKLIADLCNNGSELNKRYMKSFECIQKATDEAEQCQEKFSLSQKLIQEEIQDERNKGFHSCCAFEWLKTCKVRIAEQLCGQETSSLVDEMFVTEGGAVLSKLCGNDVESCYGRLYGVDSVGRLESSLAIWILLVFTLWVSHMYGK